MCMKDMLSNFFGFLSAGIFLSTAVITAVCIKNPEATYLFFMRPVGILVIFGSVASAVSSILKSSSGMGSGKTY